MGSRRRVTMRGARLSRRWVARQQSHQNARPSLPAPSRLSGWTPLVSLLVAGVGLISEATRRARRRTGREACPAPALAAHHHGREDRAVADESQPGMGRRPEPVCQPPGSPSPPCPSALSCS